jgi:hypothetical protein
MKNKIFLTRIIFAFVSLAVLFSCSSEKKAVKKERIIPAERLIVKLEANRRKIKTFYGSGKIIVNSPQVNSKFMFTVEFKKPDSLKITAFGPFGIDIAQLLLTNDFFNYYDAVSNVLYQGENNDKIIRKIFRMPIKAGELRNLLLGKVDFSAILHKEPSLYEFKDGDYSFVIDDPEKMFSRFYLINGDDLRLEKFELLKENNTMFNATFSKFKMVGNYSELFPFRIYVENPPNKAKFEIEYNSVKINRKLKNLKLVLPNDVKIKRL